MDLFLFDSQEWSDKTAAAVRKPIRALYEKMGRRAVAEAGASVDFTVNNPRAERFLSGHVFKFSFDVTQVTRERLRERLIKALAEGFTTDQIADTVQAEFDFAERYRAVRIARTETNTAANAGTVDGYTQAGVTKKRWIASRDSRVRETHVAVDGDEVELAVPFDVGGALMMFPGDPAGPVEEIVNCRCTTRAVV